MATATHIILHRIRMPLEVLWEIYNESITWYPRVPIKLVTKTAVPHPKSATRHPIDLYTLHRPVAPILPINTDNTTPVPSLDTLTRAWANMSMCDFSIYAFLGAMRTMLGPLGVRTSWMLAIPSLRRSATLASAGPFLLQHYLGGALAPFTDLDSADATDGLMMTLHSVFVLEFPDRRTYYVVDFSIEQYGVEHDPNWILPLDVYMQRFALDMRMQRPEDAVRLKSEGASTAMALHIDTWKGLADDVAEKWLQAVDARGYGDWDGEAWAERIEWWKEVVMGLCRQVGLGRYQEELSFGG